MHGSRGISRAKIAAQCTGHCSALAVRSLLTSILYFHFHKQLLCNSAIDAIFLILFCCNNCFYIFVCTNNLLLALLLFSLSLCQTQYYMASVAEWLV
jgi:hypothetical protein